MGLVCVNTVDVVGCGPLKACAGLEQPAHVPHVTEGIPAMKAETKSQGPKWVSEDTAE